MFLILLQAGTIFAELTKSVIEQNLILDVNISSVVLLLWNLREGSVKAWIFLILAILFEVAGTTSMKLSEGFSRLIPSILLFVFYAASFVFVTFALEKIDISIAYAIWSGVGTALISIIGIFFFREAVTVLKIVSIILIIIGVVGLNLAGARD